MYDSNPSDQNDALEINNALNPALKLYQKLGFQKVVGHASPYTRCNIQMGLKTG